MIATILVLALMPPDPTKTRDAAGVRETVIGGRVAAIALPARSISAVRGYAGSPEWCVIHLVGSKETYVVDEPLGKVTALWLKGLKADGEMKLKVRGDNKDPHLMGKSK